MKSISVLLAEDHQIVREGFRSLLQHEPDIEVVGEAETGRQAVQLTRKLRPAVVVMDIAMPLLNGLEATRQIRKDFPETGAVLQAYLHRTPQAVALASNCLSGSPIGAPEVAAYARPSSRSTSSTAGTTITASPDATLNFDAAESSFWIRSAPNVAASRTGRTMIAATFHRSGQPTNDAHDTVGRACSTTVGALSSMPYHPSPGQLTFK